MNIKSKKIILIFIYVLLGSIVNAQDSIPQFLSKISFSGGVKKSIITNNNDYRVQTLNAYIGYKFKNKISIGFNIGAYQQLNYTNKSFADYSFSGIAIKYLMFETRKNNKKKIGFEPYASYNFAVKTSSPGNEDDFNFYDIGVNVVVPKIPYFYSGTGIMQNFYSDNRNSLFVWYIAFGLRF
jgi:hypothetical protein